MAAPVTLGAITRLALLGVAVCFICIGPLMLTDDYAWTKFSDWGRGLRLVWPVAIATLAIRIVDNYRRESLAWARRKGLTQRENLSIVRALYELNQRLGQVGLRQEDGRHVRDQILRCIVFKVADVIGEGDHQKLTVSLLDFSCVESNEKDNGRMCVVARSSGERETPKEYPREHLAAWLAIKDGKPRDVLDCWKDDRFERLERGYRSIVAVPIVREGSAIAAISIDHPAMFRFWGQIRAIEMAIQPHIGIILLTYPQDVVGFPCTYDPSHSKVMA